MFLRPAILSDANAIAEVHVRAWRETYRGIMTDAVLDGLSVEASAQRWSAAISSLSEKRQLLSVAVDDLDTIVGFAGAGPPCDPALTTTGEIYAINLVNEAKRNRAGARFMLAMAEGLIALSLREVGLWVLEANTNARSFYERLGGAPVARQERDSLVELGYVWPSVDDLARHARALVAG